MKISQLAAFAPCLLAASMCVASPDADDAALCAEFRALQWPNGGRLAAFVLSSSLEVGAKQDGYDHFFNLDIDGDDIEDVVTVSCSASRIPADPCVLEVKLSTGGEINFEAWHLYLVRHRGEIYAVTAGGESDPNARQRQIYRVGPKQMRLVCSSP